MISKLFATHVLVKDDCLTDDELSEMELITQMMMAHYKAQTGLGLSEITDNSIPFFTEENISKFPVLNKVKKVFIDGFLELSESFEGNPYTREIITELVDNYAGRLPIMKKGDYKDSHTHAGATAFAILYLTDVDNERYGGKLTMFDPAGSNLTGFINKQTFSVETKKNRLVVGPANVWHSVSTYTGDDDRLAIVFNLSHHPKDD